MFALGLIAMLDYQICLVTLVSFFHISCRWLKNGKMELGVHIADVSHFVKPGSLTDLEARFRFVLQSFSCTEIVVDGDKEGAVAYVVDEPFTSHFQYMRYIFNR